MKIGVMFDPVQINKLYTFIKSKANGISTKHMSQKRTANVIENKVGFALVLGSLVFLAFFSLSLSLALLMLPRLQRLVLHSSGFISGNRHSATNILCQSLLLLLLLPLRSRLVFIFGKSKTANENCIQLSAFIVRINSWGKFH